MRFVAEIGASHGGSKAHAIELIESVAGYATHVKFQTFDPAKMAVPGQTIPSGLWRGRDMVELYEEAHTPPQWLPDLLEATIDSGMVPFSTPFDCDSVDALERLGCTVFKVASYELVDLQLVDYIASVGCPVVMSTGQAELHEIRAAVWAARKYLDDITLLHCVSEYPAAIEDANIKTMLGLRGHFPFCSVGISDHTPGDVVPIVAASMGASMIEKHISMGRGVDAGFALTPEAFNVMTLRCREAAAAVGKIRYGSDDYSLRRSLYWAEDLKAGTEVQGRHLKTSRPNLGLSPIKIEKILGKKLTKDVKKDEPVTLALGA